MKKICTSCLKNHGLKETALRVVDKKADKVVCESCTECGYYLSKDELISVMSSFFVTGSVPPEIGGPAPVFQFNEHHCPGDVEFLTELDHDVKLISQVIKVGLFHYGPPLWRLGYTEHYQSLVFDNVQGLERKNIWRNIISRCTDEIYDVGSTIFRVRTAEKLPRAIPSEFDTPPLEYIGTGRFNSNTTPIFYGATDIETCLHETRATLSDYIMLAKFSVVKPLKLLNLSCTEEEGAGTEFERVDRMLRRLAYAGKDEYEICQELAREIKDHGYDGFISHSYFGQAHKKKLYNVSLFDYPVADGELELISTNRLKITSIEYEYSYGPVNDNHVLDKAKLNELSERMKNLALNGEATQSEMNALYKEMSDLLNMRSETPI